MKKLFALATLLGFMIAVCNAMPYHVTVDKDKIEYSKKHFVLDVAELPAEMEMPAAPSVVYDLDVKEVTGQTDSVLPQSNNPPKERTPINSYSMAFKGK